MFKPKGHCAHLCVLFGNEDTFVLVFFLKTQLWLVGRARGVQHNTWIENSEANGSMRCKRTMWFWKETYFRIKMGLAGVRGNGR